MITAILNSTQATKVSFQGGALNLAKGELSAKALKIGEDAADSFSKSISKIVGKDEMPFTKKALTVADKNHGQIIFDSLGNPIKDPDMPGTYLHELAKGDPGFVEDVADSFETIKEIGKSIFKAIFDID